MSRNQANRRRRRQKGHSNKGLRVAHGSRGSSARQPIGYFRLFSLMRTSRNMLDSTEFRANRSAARAQTTCLHPNLRELSIGASSARMGTSSSEWRRRLWATRDVAATPLAVTHSGEDPSSEECGCYPEARIVCRSEGKRGVYLLAQQRQYDPGNDVVSRLTSQR